MHNIGNAMDSLIAKFNFLMITNRQKFIEQYKTADGTVKWLEKKYKLTDNVVKSHITGKRTIGIFYPNQSTIFLVFDIDVFGNKEGQENRVKGLIQNLTDAGINQEDIHVMFSGSKGYHVQLFFDAPIKINSVVAFGKAIRGKLGELSTGIELRPEGIQGRGIKLPLAFHKKSNSFAHYVFKDTFLPVPHSVNYFLSITPIKREKMLEAINYVLQKRHKKIGSKNTLLGTFPIENVDTRLERAKSDFSNMKMPVNHSSGLRKKVQKLLDAGLDKSGTRHHSQFLIALYFKEEGVSLEDAIKQMSKWITVQWKKGKSKESDLGFLLDEVNRQVRNVYEEDFTGLYDSRGRIPVMTHEDAIFASGFTNKNVRKVVWALLMIGRMYNQDGVFSADMVSIGKMVGLTRQTVSKLLKILLNNGIIELKEDYTYVENKARTYFMPALIGSNLEGTNYISINANSIKEAYEQSLLYVERLA